MFAIEISPCERCGRRGLWRSGIGDRQLTAKCRHCREDNWIEFSMLDSRESVATHELGDATSLLLDPLDFVGELQRLNEIAPDDPSVLAESVWAERFAEISRAMLCICELEKFSRADLQGFVGTQRKQWFERSRRFEEDTKRVYPDDPLATPLLAPRGELTRDAIARHEEHQSQDDLDWEQFMSIRLEVETYSARDANMAQTSISRFQFRNVMLARADLTRTKWDDGVLVNVVFDDAKMDRSFLEKWKGRNVRFERASLEESHFLVALKRGSFDGANMRGSRYDSSTFERMSFRGARLDGAELSFVDFIACDLREASFEGATTRALHGSLQDAPQVTFERCDLRGLDLRGAKLDHVLVRGCDLRGASLPADWKVIESKDGFGKL